MKSIKLLFLTAIFLSTKILCQQTYPVAIGGGFGIFVDVSGSSGNFIIERSESPFQSWTEIGKIHSPSSLEEFISRLNNLKSEFSDYNFPNEKQINLLWNIWQRANIIDSIPYWGNIPFIKIALGTMFLDKTAKLNTEYQYRASSDENLQGKEFTNSTYFPKYFQSNDVSFYSSSSETDKIIIEFRTTGEQLPSAFRVLRRDNGQGNYVETNAVRGFNQNADMLSLIFIDSAVIAYNFYNYFLIPLDLFGNKGTPSDTVFVGAYNFQNIPLPQSVQITSDDSTDAFILSWFLPNPEAVVSVRIFRSEVFDSGFVQITEVSPQTTQYVDLMTEPMKRYYYYFQLTGPLGELSPPTSRFGGFHQSTIEPIPPVNIKAESLSNGVKLQWENTEDFVEGFWVYRSNGFSDSLSLISNLIKEEPFTTFTDTSESLIGKYTYYYAIRSSSTSHMLSNFSDTVSIRPEMPTFPPAPTGLTAFQQDDNSVKVGWDDMADIESSVGYYIIFRRIIDPSAKTTTEFEPLIDSVLSADKNYFVDSTVEAGNSYEYAVTSFDLYGGQSELSNPVSFNYSFPETPSPGGLAISRQTDGVLIRWDAVMQDDISEYRVYRQQRDEEKDFLGSVKKGKPLQLVDRGMTRGELYFYTVTAVNNNQQESAPSYTVSIRP